MATAIASIISLLIGLVLGHILTGFREHARWVNDRKRSEYSELLDQLYETVTAGTEKRPSLSERNLEPINNAVKMLARLFEDRLSSVLSCEGPANNDSVRGSETG